MSAIRIAAVAIAALAAAPAWASDDAPVSTKPAMTTAEQIDAYLRSAPPVDAQDDGVAGITLTKPDRKPHGVAEVSIGTGGYRSFYARSDMPVGKTGTLSIAVQDSRSNRGFGGPYGYGGGYRSLGIGLAMGDAAEPGSPRCRRPYGAMDEFDRDTGCRRSFAPGPYGP